MNHGWGGPEMINHAVKIVGQEKTALAILKNGARPAYHDARILETRHKILARFSPFHADNPVAMVQTFFGGAVEGY